MRFPLVAVLFIVISFIFFAFWAFGSLLGSTVSDALDDIDNDLPSDYHNLMSMLTPAFGIICAVFFVTGILLVFILESLSDEPEYYYRER